MEKRGFIFKMTKLPFVIIAWKMQSQVIKAAGKSVVLSKF